jgi:signal peptidase
MSHNPKITLILVLAVGIALTIFRPGGLMAYFVPSICWATLALTTLYMAGGLEQIRSWTNRRITLMALLAAVFYIFILIDAGLINKFGNSPLSFTPTGIAINFILVSSTLLGMEMSRGYLTKNLNRKNPTLTLAAITILYTFINVSIFALINFQDPLTYTKYMGENFLPILTENLLATYLALISGPLASLAYRAPLQAFQWFSPILPDLPWGYKALIGVMIPTIGFIAINMATTQRDLRKAGIPIKTRPTLRPRESQKSMKGWLAISVFLVLTVWTSTGLLGFYPTIIASGSMTPTMDVGDLAMVIPVDPSKIQVGDIIQFWNGEEMILHRVIDIGGEGSTIFFQTKGDDNPTPDSDPVLPAQIRGKLILTIPKLGWISIYFKTAITSTWTFLSTNTTIAYAILTTITLTTSTYTIHTHKNRPHRHWQKRRR